mgnify:CR=1 FL=1
MMPMDVMEKSVGRYSAARNNFEPLNLKFNMIANIKGSNILTGTLNNTNKNVFLIPSKN